MKKKKRSKVAVIRCNTYDGETVYEAVCRGIDLLGGIKAFVCPGEKILLKPNVLRGSHPQKCVTTHPAVFKAVGRLCQKAGCTLSYGDSPGFGNVMVQMKKSLLAEAAEELGISCVDFSHGREITYKKNSFVYDFVIAHGVLEADGIISLAKMKTHGFMRITGAVKNQFGCITGRLKARWHVRLPDYYDFARMLVCINLLIKPRLYILDGIMAMDGNGPSGGDPFPMNTILISSDPVALDAVFCHLIHLDPVIVPTNTAGEEFGLGIYRLEQIDIAGEPIQKLANKNFSVSRKKYTLQQGSMALLSSIISRRPVIKKKLCTRCGICIATCPVTPKALSWPKKKKKRPPEYHYQYCIRCFCCQENCPQKAIEIKRPLPGKIISLFF